MQTAHKNCAHAAQVLAPNGWEETNMLGLDSTYESQDSRSDMMNQNQRVNDDSDSLTDSRRHLCAIMYHIIEIAPTSLMDGSKKYTNTLQDAKGWSDGYCSFVAIQNVLRTYIVCE
eukprot:2453680-Amphidinium_carterae.1